MTDSHLVRGRWIVTGAGDGDPILEDGGLRITGNEIVDRGHWDDLRARYPNDAVLGGTDCAVIPGLINAHHHSSGVTAQQHGLADDFLEPWILAHGKLRKTDVGLNTLLSAARLLRSGVTSVVDVHSGAGTAKDYDDRVKAGLAAYHQSGMRVAFAAGTTSRSHLVHGDAQADEVFLSGLPRPLADDVRRLLLPGPDNLTVDEYFAIIEEACQRYHDDPRIDVWFAPPGPQWVGDSCLLRIAEQAAKLDAGIQTHLLESHYEKLMGARLYGKAPLCHLHDLGILGPRFSIAHGVWLSDEEIEIMAETGTAVSHNPSSNLRLRAGIAPLNALLAAEVTTGLGMDGTSLNDDEDMFTEMRLALRLNRGPILDDPAPGPRDVLAAATLGGAKLMGKSDHLGRLAVGYCADLVLLDLERITAPWSAPEIDPLALIVLRARADDVRSVVVGGRLVYHEGRVTGFELEPVASELATKLAEQTFPDHRAQVVEKLVPYILDHYRAWDHPVARPYTAYNSRQ